MKRLTFLTLLALLLMAFQQASGQELKLNDLEYFETQGVNFWFTATFLPEGSTMKKPPVLN